MTISRVWIDSGYNACCIPHWMFIVGVYRVDDEVTFAFGFFTIKVLWT